MPAMNEKMACAALIVLAIVMGSGAAANTIQDCRDCPKMVVVPAGSFLMGSPANEPSRDAEEGPQHRVTIARAFALGEYDVMRGQYAAFVAATNHAVTNARCDWADPKSRGEPLHQTESEPVVCVSWNDAVAYTAWLTAKTGHTYRLPSEAEWEYAARAGTTTARPWGDAPVQDHANVGAETCCGPATGGRDTWRFTSPVGSFPPNAFGLTDMLGNVWQWTADCAYGYAAPADKDCAKHMVRGGAWFQGAESARSAARAADDTDFRVGDIGFRVARDL